MSGLVFIGLLTLLGQLAAIADSKVQPYDIRTVEDGWQPAAVTAILQSRAGYLWLGTYSGLLRFDGARFAHFDSGNTPGLRNSRITSLYEDEAGTLWIGHETGELSRHDATGFHAATPGKPVPGAAIEALNQDEHGDLWWLNSEGLLSRLRDGHSVRVQGGASAERKASLQRARDGTLWVTANGRVATLQSGRLVPCGFDRPAAEVRDYFERVVPSLDGGVWVGTGGGLRKWNHGKWTTEIRPTPYGPGVATLLMETRSGKLLAGTLRHGLYLFDPAGGYQHFSRANGLSHDWVRSACEDHEGNLWIGTGSGLDVLRSRRVEMWSPPDAFQGCAVLSFSLSPTGDAWIGTEGAGLYHHSNQGWTSYRETAGVSNVFVWSVLETRRGRLLAGTWGGGVLAREENHFSRPKAFDAITSPVLALFESRSGAVYIGTQTGLYRWREGLVELVAGKDQLAFPDVRAITETPDGTLWFAMSGGGLGAWKDGTVRQWRKADGMPTDSALCLRSECDGTLWIGTLDRGLCRLKAGKFSVIGPEQGLPATSISHIVDDERGFFWMGSREGIVRARKDDLNRCADGLSPFVRCLSTGKAEGMATPACTSGFQPGACRTADGRLWFPTAKGIAVVDPAQVKENPTPPPVIIEEFLVNDLPHTPPASAPPPNRPISAQPARARFEFHFTALSFVAPEKVRFRYRLEGVDETWQSAGTERSVRYNHLPPGNYTFRVTACNNDGVWNETGAALAFVVLPRFWQTWWFFGLAVAAGVGLVTVVDASLSRRRVRHHLEQVERQRAVERERTRIARDIHDDLGASLTRITMLSQSVLDDLGGAQPVAGDVNSIYHTARDLTRAMDEIVWAVNPKHDTLDSLVTYLGRFAQSYLGPAGLRCRLDVPVHLPQWSLTAETRHNVFLAFKEALHNSVKHARAAEITVTLELSASAFTLRVQDDGCGFDPPRTAPLPDAGPGGDRISPGNGLANMRKRLEEIGGRCELKTGVNEGTGVAFHVPVGNRKG
jgi:signal transduction histidine kinase/ligand-binding sensor domain-containing protein